MNMKTWTKEDGSTVSVGDHVRCCDGATGTVCTMNAAGRAFVQFDDGSATGEVYLDDCEVV